LSDKFTPDRRTEIKHGKKPNLCLHPAGEKPKLKKWSKPHTTRLHVSVSVSVSSTNYSPCLVLIDKKSTWITHWTGDYPSFHSKERKITFLLIFLASVFPSFRTRGKVCFIPVLVLYVFVFRGFSFFLLIFQSFKCASHSDTLKLCSL
jgi:hypothetical protein